MKKITAFLLASFIILFVFAGCQKKIYFDEEEYSKAVSESQSKEEESISIQQEDISEERVELENKIGKSEKNKQLVIHEFAGDHDEYYVIYFKKGVATSRVTYKFFYDSAYYYSLKENESDDHIAYDDNTLCLTYENKDIIETDYDWYYEQYAKRDPAYYEIIE